jgi:cholesterol oxidase
MSYDVIVIGSGFGGAVVACRLQEHGYRVLVLERGRRWDRSNFPREPTDPWIWDGDAPEQCNGWLELRPFPNMTVATGAAVGGGSLIYANISSEAHSWRFDQGWPKEITYDELKPYYDRVKQFMNVREVPDNQWTPRMKLMKDAAIRAGFGDKFRKLELAVTFDNAWTYETHFHKGAVASLPIVNAHGCEQGTCVHLGNCDIGCEVHAKNTLDRNYLFVAEKKGADIRPLHLVTNLEPIPAGFRVHYDKLVSGTRIGGSEDARIVVLAAGSLGSTELLLRCKYVTETLPNVSDALGQRWSSNGEFLTFGIYDDCEVQPTWGPTIGAVIDFYDRHNDGGFWIQDGGVPDLAASLIDRKAADPNVSFKAMLMLQQIQSLLRENEPFGNIMPWFAQGIDAADGSLSLRPRSPLDSRLQLHLQWDVQRSRQVIEQILQMHERLTQVTGGQAVIPPTWTLFKDLITTHPLGGCNMGSTRTDGVVDHRGSVFNYPSLYVIDGAIIPEALGVNPSRTIAALAERASTIMISELA